MLTTCPPAVSGQSQPIAPIPCRPWTMRPTAGATACAGRQAPDARCLRCSCRRCPAGLQLAKSRLCVLSAQQTFLRGGERRLGAPHALVRRGERRPAPRQGLGQFPGRRIRHRGAGGGIGLADRRSAVHAATVRRRRQPAVWTLVPRRPGQGPLLDTGFDPAAAPCVRTRCESISRRARQAPGRSAQIVVGWHAVRNTGINGPELGVQVCRQLLGAPLGLC